MFCPRCGNLLESNSKFCNKCGNQLQNLQDNSTKNIKTTIQNTSKASPNINYTQQSINNMQYDNAHSVSSQNYYDKGNKKKFIFIGVGAGISVVILCILISIIIGISDRKYYFDNNTHENNESIVQNNSSSTSKKGKYSTVIIYDNTYSGVTIDQDKDAYKLIEKDSMAQKSNCPSEIKSIENEIIEQYGITAVNLCEMDVNFARELGNVIKKIYNEYPSARGYITNLSLANVSMSEGYIAAFMPVFNFATSKTSTTYPWVIKTQVLLNTAYFLNTERLQASVTDGSNVGHFPPNATIYSPVAHEFGHYLSFLAMMRHHELNSILLVDNKNVNTFYDIYSDFGKGNFSLKMINEAFDNYKRDTGATMSLDEWRGTISKYALAKDNNGNYIWDETIAESFHDVYLNGDNAKDASKYIVSVLKSKLGS